MRLCALLLAASEPGIPLQDVRMPACGIHIDRCQTCTAHQHESPYAEQPVSGVYEYIPKRVHAPTTHQMYPGAIARQQRSDQEYCLRLWDIHTISELPVQKGIWYDANRNEERSGFIGTENEPFFRKS